MDGTICLITDLKLGRYIYTACKNWNNYKSDNKVVASNEKNNEETWDIKGLLDNPYALYDIYN